MSVYQDLLKERRASNSSSGYSGVRSLLEKRRKEYVAPKKEAQQPYMSSPEQIANAKTTAGPMDGPQQPVAPTKTSWWDKTKSYLTNPDTYKAAGKGIAYGFNRSSDEAANLFKKGMDYAGNAMLGEDITQSKNPNELVNKTLAEGKKQTETQKQEIAKMPKAQQITADVTSYIPDIAVLLAGGIGGEAGTATTGLLRAQTTAKILAKATGASDKEIFNILTRNPGLVEKFSTWIAGKTAAGVVGGTVYGTTRAGLEQDPNRLKSIPQDIAMWTAAEIGFGALTAAGSAAAGKASGLIKRIAEGELPKVNEVPTGTGRNREIVKSIMANEGPKQLPAGPEAPKQLNPGTSFTMPGVDLTPEGKSSYTTNEIVQATLNDIKSGVKTKPVGTMTDIIPPKPEPVDKIPTNNLVSEQGSKVYTELENSQAGKRLVVENGTVTMKSSFPQWIPQELRTSKNVKAVMEHMKNGTIPTNKSERDLYDVVNAEIKNRLGSNVSSNNIDINSIDFNNPQTPQPRTSFTSQGPKYDITRGEPSQVSPPISSAEVVPTAKPVLPATEGIKPPLSNEALVVPKTPVTQPSTPKAEAPRGQKSGEPNWTTPPENPPKAEKQIPINDEPVVSTGKIKKSAAYERVNKIISEDMRDQMDLTKTHNQASLMESAKKAVDIVYDTPERGLRIARGLENVDDTMRSHVISALLDKALNAKDLKLATEMANTYINSGTRLGQELVARRGLVDDSSPISYVRQVLADRKMQSVGKTKGLTPEVQATMVEQKLIKVSNNVKIVNNLIDGLTCKG